MWEVWLSRWILVSSGLVLALSGAGLLFMPQEIAAFLGGSATAATLLLAQLLGCALFALGLIDWNSRANLMGGIYGRPLALGNFFFFAIAAVSMGRELAHLPRGVIGAEVGLAAFAVAFGWILFLADPVKARDSQSGG